MLPFIRQTRDKRGFEHTYVMHNGRPGSGPPRVLYVFRSPGNIRVGRKALDGEVREALEHTHPDLSFDWNALSRDAVVTRAEAPQPRPQKNAKARPQAPPPPPPSPVPAPVPDDHSLLGRTLGAAQAARLRNRFGEVSQRIARRARTPEEREALLEKAKNLNPDGWGDSDVIRTRASTFDAELDSLAAELPSRRRGRRGGRHRHEAPREAGQTGSSAIIARDDEGHENSHEPSLDPPDRAADPGGDAGFSTADSEAEAGFPIDD